MLGSLLQSRVVVRWSGTLRWPAAGSLVAGVLVAGWPAFGGTAVAGARLPHQLLLVLVLYTQLLYQLLVLLLLTLSPVFKNFFEIHVSLLLCLLFFFSRWQLTSSHQGLDAALILHHA